jgi:hypothetical protein
MHFQEGVLVGAHPGTVVEEAQMRMETGSQPSSDTRAIDHAALDRLRRDLLHTPPITPEQVEEPADHADFIDYASVEFEVERMRKRLAIWEIFMAYMRNGATSWSQLQQALSSEDFDRIMAICDGIPLRDLLLDLR